MHCRSGVWSCSVVLGKRATRTCTFPVARTTQETGSRRSACGYEENASIKLKWLALRAIISQRTRHLPCGSGLLSQASVAEIPQASLDSLQQKRTQWHKQARMHARKQFYLSKEPFGSVPGLHMPNHTRCWSRSRGSREVTQGQSMRSLTNQMMSAWAEHCPAENGACVSGDHRLVRRATIETVCPALYCVFDDSINSRIFFTAPLCVADCAMLNGYRLSTASAPAAVATSLRTGTT